MEEYSFLFNGYLLDQGEVTFWYETTAFSVTAVPLPAGGGLLLAGFAGLAALRRRR